MNFDGALFRTTDTAGVEIILMDHKDAVVFALSRKEEGLYEVDDIEALAALREL